MNNQITFQARRSDGAVGGIVVLPLETAREFWRSQGCAGTLWPDTVVSVSVELFQAALQISESSRK